jgi:hypothetical protein
VEFSISSPARPLIGDAVAEPLFVEPDAFHAPAIEEAVDHEDQPLHMRLPWALVQQAGARQLNKIR